MSNRLAILFPLANPARGFQSLDFSVSPAGPSSQPGAGRRGLLVFGASTA